MPNLVKQRSRITGVDRVATMDSRIYDTVLKNWKGPGRRMEFEKTPHVDNPHHMTQALIDEAASVNTAFVEPLFVSSPLFPTVITLAFKERFAVFIESQLFRRRVRRNQTVPDAGTPNSDIKAHS